ncbi:MAG: hypothetical protein Q4G05_00170 [Clostridia bacterium]|nr:hypothetical protein [Clostridia bacterium]
MNKNIENELLKAKSLDEFRNIIIKYNIKNIDEISQNVLKHHNSLGNGQSAKNHIDYKKLKK